jgi:hypothetical protein
MFDLMFWDDKRMIFGFGAWKEFGSYASLIYDQCRLGGRNNRGLQRLSVIVCSQHDMKESIFR